MKNIKYNRINKNKIINIFLKLFAIFLLATTVLMIVFLVVETTDSPLYLFKPTGFIHASRAQLTPVLTKYTINKHTQNSNHDRE